MINRIARSYFDLPSNILFLFWVELCLNLVHVGFILILNIYLRSEGFSDPEIASFNSLRFIGALAFSLPLGIYIKSKNASTQCLKEKIVLISLNHALNL